MTSPGDPQLWFTVLERYHRTSCVVSDLIVGNSYAFRVFAENQCGLSETAPVTADLAHIQKAGKQAGAVGNSPQKERTGLKWGKALRCHIAAPLGTHSSCLQDQRVCPAGPLGSPHVHPASRRLHHHHWLRHPALLLCARLSQGEWGARGTGCPEPLPATVPS